MKERFLYILCGLSLIMLGLLIYIFFREGTYINTVLGISGYFAEKSFPCSVLIKYYLTDLLWCASLTFFLYAIFLPEENGAIVLALTAFSCGCLWELLQYMGIVSGTGDIIDCIMYFAGAIQPVIIKKIMYTRRKNV